MITRSTDDGNRIAACYLSALTLCGALAALEPLAAQAQYIRQKPVFDTSVLPPKRSPFQINLKHTDIIYPQDTRTSLRGKNDFFDLRGSSVTLQGGVSSQERVSELSTVEHGIKAKFHLDLRAMIPKLAPDIARRLDAEVAESGRRLAAQVEAAEPLMKAQQQTPKQAGLMPGKPQVAAPDLGPKLAAAVNQQPLRGGIPYPANPRGSMPSPAQANTKMPGAPTGGFLPSLGGLFASGGAGLGDGGGGAAVPSTVGLRDGGAGGSTSAALNKAQKDMQAQLANARRKANTTASIASPQVSANLKLPPNGTGTVNATLRIPSVAAAVTPDLDALKAKAGALPPNAMPSVSATLLGENSRQGAILWDSWHKRFSKLAGDSVLKALNEVGSPKGKNSVAVTVWPNNHMEVSISKSGGSKFDQAVLKAYRSLDGSKTLSYPAGSLRSSVSFVVDNIHASTDVISVVNSKATTGDKELLHH